MEKLKAEGLKNVEAVQIDLTDTASVQAARAEIGSKTCLLDVLINNAGVNGGRPQTSLGATIDQFQTVFDTNLYGVVRVTQAFIDLLKKITAATVAEIAYQLGFEHPQSFSRMFKTKTKLSPLAFRKSFKIGRASCRERVCQYV